MEAASSDLSGNALSYCPWLQNISSLTWNKHAGSKVRVKIKIFICTQHGSQESSLFEQVVSNVSLQTTISTGYRGLSQGMFSTQDSLILSSYLYEVF